MYVYRRSEKWTDEHGCSHTLYTVGFYEPGTNKWIPESDHDTEQSAANRVHFLNGGK